MIRIFEYAKFYPLPNCPIDRNRYEVAARLDANKFMVCAFGRSHSFPNHIKGIMSKNQLDTVRQVFSFNPDIIHTRAWPRCLIMKYLVMLKKPKCKHILTLHGMPEKQFLGEKRLINDADAVTSVSENTAELARKEYNVDSVVIHDGIDTKIFKPKKHYNERLQVLFVGRYVWFKHPHYVVKLAKYFPKCDFLMYGSGHLENSWIAEASKLKNVRVNPPVPHEEMPLIYANSDIFLFPSVIEGWSTVVLEALACGLPVVCFNISSFPEIIGQSESGLLANNFGEMKDKLEYLIENEEVRREFSRNARSRALEFDWDIIAPKWAKLFEEVAG
jgi:glycosyltransferase involved in cell wall biosynthesis